MTDQKFPRDDPNGEDEVAVAEQRQQAAARALRRFVARHNWHALTLALFSAVAAVGLWGLAYLLTYWFTLVLVTVSRSMNPDTLLEVNDLESIRQGFPWWFLGAVLAALVVAWLVRGRVRMESLRDARHYFLWVVVELLMTLPNVTFSVWGNLSALVQLGRAEATDAWRLLERVGREGGRLSMASLPLEIEDERQLQHIVFTLQIVGLVDMREKKEGWFLCLHDAEAFALLSRAGDKD